MPANPFNPLEQNPPRRPGLTNDLGPDLSDSTVAPPDPKRHPISAVWNAIRALIAGFFGVVPHTVITIAYSGGSPVIVALQSANSQLVSGMFTLARTGGGDAFGDLSLTVVATGSFTGFPAPVCDACAHVTGDVEIDRCRTAAIANGWRIRTRLGAVGTDARVTLLWF